MFFLFFLSIIGAGFFLVTRYNALQQLAQGVKEAHANVLAAMKKKLDLANKLVDIAKGYADHEKLIHISVAQGQSDQAVLSSSADVASVVNNVVRLATQYPELKANATYQTLMGQMETYENQIQQRRETYNAQVKHYNTAITMLPVSLFAAQMGFKSAPYFDVENADAMEAIKDFHSEDGELVKQMLVNGGRRAAQATAEAGKAVAAKAQEIQARRAAAAQEGTPVIAGLGMDVTAASIATEPPHGGNPA